MRHLRRLAPAALVLCAAVLTAGCVDAAVEAAVDEGIAQTAPEAGAPSWAPILPAAVLLGLLILALLPWWLPRLHALVRAVLFGEPDRSERPPDS